MEIPAAGLVLLPEVERLQAEGGGDRVRKRQQLAAIGAEVESAVDMEVGVIDGRLKPYGAAASSPRRIHRAAIRGDDRDGTHARLRGCVGVQRRRDLAMGAAAQARPEDKMADGARSARGAGLRGNNVGVERSLLFPIVWRGTFVGGERVRENGFVELGGMFIA